MEPWKSPNLSIAKTGVTAASMGPRRWSRGREIELRLKFALAQRFNGATAMEPWKRSGNSRSHRAASRSFNGATAMEPWKRTIRSIQRCGRSSLQWGHGDGAVEEALPTHLLERFRAASMGPRRWSRGRLGRPIAALRSLIGFNGATAMEPWKRNDYRDRIRERLQLQWGHGDGAVEEHSRCATGAKDRRFNGATAMEPWKSYDLRGVRPAGRLLQWGHGDGAVEEARLWYSSWRDGCFNGATAMEPWKRAWYWSQRPRAVSLQWGHGDGAVEELDLAFRCSSRIEASMGPRRWSRGRGPWLFHPIGRARQASMGPRRWSRGRASASRSPARC